MMKDSRVNPRDANATHLASRRTSSSLTDGVRSPRGARLSTHVIQAVKIVNAIIHLIDKDWGTKTSQVVRNARRQWTTYRVDDAHYVPASQRDFYTLLQVQDLTNADGKDFNYTRVVIPEYRSKSTPAIRITRAMPVSAAHGALDNFTYHICYKLQNEVDREPEKWSFSNGLGISIPLKPINEGRAGISRRLVEGHGGRLIEPDKRLVFDWREKGLKKGYWPFWIHQSCISEKWTHVEKKALSILYRSKGHVSIISILNMELGKSSPEQPEDWRVYLSIWRIEHQEAGNGKYLPVADRLKDRVQVYPKDSDASLTVVITKRDLVTVSRSQDESLADIKVEIDLAEVFETARRAVEMKELENMSLPSSPADSDQLAPSSPPGGTSDGSDASYQDEEGSEKAASQREDMSLRRPRHVYNESLSPIDNNSQDSFEDGLDEESEGMGRGIEEDDESDPHGPSEYGMEQETEDHTAELDEYVGVGASRRGDASEADTSPK